MILGRLGLQKAKSIKLKEPFGMFKCVYSIVFNKLIFDLSSMFSIIFPLVSVFAQLRIVLCLLKFITNKNDLESYCIRSTSSASSS